MAHYDWYCMNCNWEGGIYKDEREPEYIPLSIPNVSKVSNVVICSDCLTKASNGKALYFHPWSGVIEGKHYWKLINNVLVLQD